MTAGRQIQPAPFIDVAVFTTRSFRKGEKIDLRGGTARLSDEQDDQMRLEANKIDFSVIWSTRCVLSRQYRVIS